MVDPLGSGDQLFVLFIESVQTLPAGPFPPLMFQSFEGIQLSPQKLKEPGFPQPLDGEGEDSSHPAGLRLPAASPSSVQVLINDGAQPISRCSSGSWGKAETKM